MFAALGGRTGTVQALITARANLNLQRPDGTTALMAGRVGFAGTFKGYYNESVADSALETWRCRHLFIRFFLGDSTTEVNEVEVS